MAGTITRGQRQQIADMYYSNFTENNTYLFIGKITSWTDEFDPPATVNSTLNSQLQVWKDILALKKIQVADISYCIPRNDWTSGVAYRMYTDDTDSSNNSFFVITDDFNVYKCLYNNKGAPSTVKPTGRPTASFKTNDNYQWKYMYTISAPDVAKFVTNQYVPNKVLSEDDGTNQWSVQQAAANCSIETYFVSSAGNTYPTHTGTVVSSNSSSVRLAAGASASGGLYVGSSVYIRAGTGIGQLRTITGYNGTTKTALINSNWSVNPDNTSTYVVSPRVTVNGDGVNATAWAEMNGNGLTRVNSVNIGRNYTYATVAISANTGSGAVVKPIISPQGGHGANSVFELNSYNVMMNIKLTGTESNTFIVENSFRTFGLVINPIYLANNSPITQLSYKNTTTFTISGVSGTFLQNEEIVGGTSGARGYIATKTDSTHFEISGITKVFQAAETITGSTSGATATLSTIANPLTKQLSGRVVYIENKPPISRSADQEENFKLVLSF